MPRKTNVRENEKIMEYVRQGMKPSEIVRELKAKRMNVPQWRVRYYAQKFRKEQGHATEPVAPEAGFSSNYSTASLEQKVFFSTKILDESALDVNLRIKLVRDILAFK